MPKRSREEKLAAYSAASKRGYRARKRMLEKRKEPSPGEVKALWNDDPGRIVALRDGGTSGSGYAAQNDRDKRKCNLAKSEQSVNRVMHSVS